MKIRSFVVALTVLASVSSIAPSFAKEKEEPAKAKTKFPYNNIPVEVSCFEGYHPTQGPNGPQHPCIKDGAERGTVTPVTAANGADASKQTQGQSFGEKVASGLQSGAGALASGARTPAASATGGTMTKPGGAVSSSYARGTAETPAGQASDPATTSAPPEQPPQQ